MLMADVSGRPLLLSVLISPHILFSVHREGTWRTIIHTRSYTHGYTAQCSAATNLIKYKGGGNKKKKRLLHNPIRWSSVSKHYVKVDLGKGERRFAHCFLSITRLFFFLYALYAQRCQSKHSWQHFNQDYDRLPISADAVIEIHLEWPLGG